jgi:hypothetical protein
VVTIGSSTWRTIGVAVGDGGLSTVMCGRDLSVAAAMRLAPHMALEVLIEVQELVWKLEANAESQLTSQPLHGAVDGLRNELAAARAEHRNDPETCVRRFPMVAALTHQHAN